MLPVYKHYIYYGLADALFPLLPTYLPALSRATDLSLYGQTMADEAISDEERRKSAVPSVSVADAYRILAAHWDGDNCPAIATATLEDLHQQVSYDDCNFRGPKRRKIMTSREGRSIMAVMAARCCRIFFLKNVLWRRHHETYGSPFSLPCLCVCVFVRARTRLCICLCRCEHFVLLD